MRQIRALVAVVALAAIPVTLASGRPADAPRAPRARALAPKVESVPGELIVKLRPIAGKLPVEALDAVGAREVEPLTNDGSMVLAAVDGDAAPAIARLSRDPRVEFAEPNLLWHACATPDDPKYPNQWGLDDPTGDGDMRVSEAWDVTTGSSSVVVAVIDGGIDLEHPDLVDNIYRNPREIPGNGVDDDHDGFVDDVSGWDFVDDDATPSDTFGHGTHVSGILGARGNNGKGVTGVCWNVSILPIKFLDGETGTTSNAVRALQYVASIRGSGANVRVVNCSWGGYGYSNALDFTIASMRGSDVLFVCAAGNESLSTDSYPHYPSSLPYNNVVSVGASDYDARTASFSNIGRASVDVLAPGMDIVSTIPGGEYGTKSGTSMAAPCVSGVAALVASVYPDASAASIKARLLGATEARNRDELRYACLERGHLVAPLALRADAVPPAVPADFRVTSASESGASFEWTAVGDDGSSGSAAYYDLRFGDSPLIGPGTFETAQQMPDNRIPLPAGSRETAAISGCGVARFAALRVYDAAGNYAESPLVEIVPTSSVPRYEAGAGYAPEGGGPTDVAFGDDESALYQLPFPFEFYGVRYDAVYVSTNGLLTFGKPRVLSPISTNELSTQPGIAPLWSDLVTSVTADARGDRVTFGWVGERFDTWARRPGEIARTIAFSVTLSADGTIAFGYDRVRNGDLSSPVVGSPIVGISDGGCHPLVLDGYDRQSSLRGAPAVALRPVRDDGLPSPSLSVGSVPSVLEGETIHVPVTASSPLGEPVHVFAASFVDGYGYYDPNYFEYVYTPSSIDAGSRRVVLTATDASGHSTTTEVRIQVTDNPRLAEISSVKVTRKKIVITGRYIAPGAVIVANGDAEADSRVSANGTKISSKAARQNYNPTLTIRNPDGSYSNGYQLP